MNPMCEQWNHIFATSHPFRKQYQIRLYIIIYLPIYIDIPKNRNPLQPLLIARDFPIQNFKSYSVADA